MAEEGKGGVREGLRNSVGLLVAFKEAVQETLEEARDRGDFSTEKARALVQEAAQKVQHSVEEAREKLDLVPRKEFDDLKAEVEALRERIAQLESGTVALLTPTSEAPTSEAPTQRSAPAPEETSFPVDG